MLPPLHARLDDDVEWVVQRWMAQCDLMGRRDAAEIILAVYEGLHTLALAVSRSAEQAHMHYRFPYATLDIVMMP